MKRTTIAILATLVAGPVCADPSGRYSVTGTNPDSGGTYTGSVTVKRVGATYDVRWSIAGTEYRGSGIGALIRDQQFVAGPAEKADTSIAVGYVADGTFGVAHYFEQPDGTWRGVWTYAGSGKVAIEEWRRK